MRYTFGGSPADYAMERVGNQLLVRPAAVGTVWDSLTGGTQLTDLTDLAGNPIASVTADADGAVTFMGPDGVTACFVDFGYSRRFALVTTDIGDVITAFLAQGGEPGGWAVLDGSGNIDASQIPAQLDWIVVRSYGALGDGTHDDTNAIQNAINACAPGGVVYFPRGVYKTTATLDLKNGVSLVGSHANMMVGPGMTGADYPCYIQPVAPFTGTSVLQIIGDADGTHPDISGEQRLTNLMFDGSLLTGSSIDGIFAKGNVQNVVMENVTIRQMPNNGIVTASRTDGKFPFSWRLRHVMIDNCHANGILFTGNTDLTLDDVQVIGCWAQGFILTNCTNSQVVMCRAEWNGSHGFHITGAWGNWAGSGGMLLGDCTTDRNGQHGVLIDATGNTPIQIANLETRRDGRNGGTGGGNYAGLAVIGATVPVIADVVSCYPGVDDGGASTNSPQYGARISGSTTVLLDNAYLHGNTAGLLDDGTNTLVSLGSNIVTAVGATTSTARTLSGASAKGLAGARYVAASNASAREKARADWVCDGTADNVEIQAAIAAVQAEGGGIVQLSPGGFTLAASLTINGNLDENDPRTVTLRGCGAQVTELTVAANTVGITISNWAQVNLSDFGLFISGSGIGIKSVGVNDTGNNNTNSFWHSSFRNLRVNGGFVATDTVWAMELGMPWRSVFENIEVEGCRNGIKVINNSTIQNAGDCVFSRIFVEIVGTGGYGLYIDSQADNMNQNLWHMFEAGAGSGTSGTTGIYLGGTAGTASQRFYGLNLEQFDTLINVAAGDSNEFYCNYITAKDGGATNKAFVTGANAYNNLFQAKWVQVKTSGALKLIEDGNTTDTVPNIFEKICIHNATSGNVTWSQADTAIFRDIVAFNSGTIQAGLLQLPQSDKALATTSALTTTSTTLADISGLGPWVYPGTYLVEAEGFVQTSATTAYPKIALGGTATWAGTGSSVTLEVGTSPTAVAIARSAAANGESSNGSISATATDVLVRARGTVVITAAGTLRLRWRAAAAGTLTLQPGAYIRVKKIL